MVAKSTIGNDDKFRKIASLAVAILLISSTASFALPGSLPVAIAQEVTDPAASDPAASDPAASDPAASDPAASDPAPTTDTSSTGTQPVITEEDYSTAEVFQKEITINPTVTADTAVVVTTEIPENLVQQGVEFQLYQVDGTTKTEVAYDSAAVEFVDTDGDSVADQLQWQVPQTSEQTFVIQGIIVTTAAEHLDSSRVFIENVYAQTNAQDGIWTNPIPADDYIRVTFEQALTSSNDITIYARSSEGGSIEVYEKDGTTPIANFGTISDENTYKIFLSNLSTSQDTFDLRIVGNPIEFDFIIDPASISLEQCHNKETGNFNACSDPPLGANYWGSGNAGSNNALLRQGDSQNYRFVMKSLAAATHTLVWE